MNDVKAISSESSSLDLRSLVDWKAVDRRPRALQSRLRGSSSRD
jgi:hypothetical protein